jgi:TRAP-type C4-dicarboxylate transport system substrate-binding protein
MRKLFFLTAVIFSFVCLGPGFVSRESAASQILKFATAYEVTNPMTTSMRWFANELEKRTNNQYKTQVYYSGMIGKPPDLPNL